MPEHTRASSLEKVGKAIERAPPPEYMVSGGYRSGRCGELEKLSSRPTVAGVVTRNVQVTADSDMIGVVPVRTRPLFTHAGSLKSSR